MNSYHITFGTYGTRLHGDRAPTVRKPENHFGDPFVEENEFLRTYSRNVMKESPCLLTLEQRLFVEETIPTICERGKWIYSLAGCEPDHVHVLLSTEAESKAVRKWLKTWLTQSLNERFGKRTWFAEGGSGKWIKDEQYFNNVYQYILKQRAHNQIT